LRSLLLSSSDHRRSEATLSRQRGCAGGRPTAEADLEFSWVDAKARCFRFSEWKSRSRIAAAFNERTEALTAAEIENSELLKPDYAKWGFLPENDPLIAFPTNSRYAVLDELGRDLPSLLYNEDFRAYARQFEIPAWQEPVTEETLPQLRLYYVRVGFLASGYVNQVGAEPAKILPRNIATPLVAVTKLLNRPPILSYDGYALYNWKRLRKEGPIQLGNIDTIQNFVHMYDEHWFILVHVEIESLAADILSALATIKRKLTANEDADISQELWRIEGAVRRQVDVLKRIPEHMDPSLYHQTFRPYIRFFENVTYEDVNLAPLQFRGETGAQSSIMPTLVAFMKIPHQRSVLTDHLDDMRRYMPANHRALIKEVENMPDVRRPRHRNPYNAILDAMAAFRRIHYGWAQEYINRWTDDPRGTGGTPYMQWLNQMLLETEAHRFANPAGGR
jgi:indoleamine 2,3-dioxygenase